MNIFTYHLVEISISYAVKSLFVNPLDKETPGLVHAEYMTAMKLGAPIFSPSRFLTRQMAVFAQWENEKALDDYLQKEKFGAQLNNGWHVRLAFMRQWGKTSKFKIPEHKATLELASSPVVAVTIARMKPWAIPRFLRWGRPVEKLVRDHNGTLLSMASFKFPNTISTFSIWKTEKEMTNMVHGHSKMAQPKRHANAMKERERKSFHFEFVTLRFKPISEFGSWQEKDTYIPYFEMHTT